MKMTINSLNTNNMFGSTPLFGASTLPTFGTTNQNPFAQSSSPPFGLPNQTSNNTGLFGSTNFNFGQSSQPSGFSFSAPNSSNLFNQKSNQYVLGQSARKGTTFKYSPVDETEALLRNGVSTTGRIRFSSITCMKEYENSSFEELRFEDYAAGNKNGPLKFGATNSTSTLCGLSDHSFSSGFGSQIKPAVNTNNASLFRTPINTPNVGLDNRMDDCTSNSIFTAPTAANSCFGRTSTTGNVFSGLPNNTLFGSTNNSNTLFGNNFFGANNMNANLNKPFSLFTSQKAALPAETKRFSFDIQPTFAQASKSDSNMESCKQKSNIFQSQQPVMPTPVGFNWFNKPEPSNPPQPTFNLSNPTAAPCVVPNLLQQGFNSYPPPPSVQNFDLKSPPGIEELRNTLTLTYPFEMSSLYKDLEVHPLSNRSMDYSIKQPDFYQKSAEEILNRVDRNIKPTVNKPSDRVKDMYGLFKTVDESEQEYKLSPRINYRKLRIKHAVLPPEPLIIDPYINKQAATLKVERDIACAILPGSSDSPSILTLPKDDSNADMHQVAAKNIISGVYNSDDSNMSINNDSQTSTVNSQEPPKPNCGIKLTKPDYYTLPPLDDISKYTNQDGACLVKGFTVGRVGFGNVYFPEAFDVSNLDLDKIVDIGYREITVYPDDGDKPPVGEGLNRRAQVTLDKIFPRREDGELETDLENLKTRRYEDTLRFISVRMNVDFVEYRPETGSWVFIVPHF